MKVNLDKKVDVENVHARVRSRLKYGEMLLSGLAGQDVKIETLRDLMLVSLVLDLPECGKVVFRGIKDMVWIEVMNQRYRGEE